MPPAPTGGTGEAHSDFRIFGNSDSPPPPLHVLPAALVEAVEAFSKAYEVEPAAPFAALLAAFARPAGRLYAFPEPNGEERTCNLGLILALESNGGKTETWRWTNKTANALAARWAKANAAKRKKYRDDHRRWVTDVKADPELPEPEPPAESLVFLGETTPEAAKAAIMAGSYFNWHTDELHDALNKVFKGGYSGHSFKDLIMNLLDGHMPSSLTKSAGYVAHDESAFIPFVFTGGLQPERLPFIFDDGRGTTGFAGRFLYVSSAGKDFKERDNALVAKLKPTFDRIHAPLADLWGRVERAAEASTDGDLRRACLPFTNEARDYLDCCTKAFTESECAKAAGQDSNYVACLPKLVGFKYRFALLLEVIRAASTGCEPVEIGIEAAHGARELFMFFAGQLKRVCAEVASEAAGGGRKPHPYTGKLMSAWYGEALNALPDGVELTNEAFRAAVEQFVPAGNAKEKQDRIGNLKRELTHKGYLIKTDAGCWLKSTP